MGLDPLHAQSIQIREIINGGTMKCEKKKNVKIIFKLFFNQRKINIKWLKDSSFMEPFSWWLLKNIIQYIHIIKLFTPHAFTYRLILSSPLPNFILIDIFRQTEWTNNRVFHYYTVRSYVLHFIDTCEQSFVGGFCLQTSSCYGLKKGFRRYIHCAPFVSLSGLMWQNSNFYFISRGKQYCILPL